MTKELNYIHVMVDDAFEAGNWALRAFPLHVVRSHPPINDNLTPNALAPREMLLRTLPSTNPPAELHFTSPHKAPAHHCATTTPPLDASPPPHSPGDFFASHVAPIQRLVWVSADIRQQIRTLAGLGVIFFDSHPKPDPSGCCGALSIEGFVPALGCVLLLVTYGYYLHAWGLPSSPRLTGCRV